MTESHTSDQRNAQLKWALACERLEFALSPPAGAVPEAPTGVLTAIDQAQDALDGLKVAFGSSRPVPPDQATS